MKSAVFFIAGAATSSTPVATAQERFRSAPVTLTAPPDDAQLLERPRSEKSLPGSGSRGNGLRHGFCCPTGPSNPTQSKSLKHINLEGFITTLIRQPQMGLSLVWGGWEGTGWNIHPRFSAIVFICRLSRAQGDEALGARRVFVLNRSPGPSALAAPRRNQMPIVERRIRRGECFLSSAEPRSDGPLTLLPLKRSTPDGPPHFTACHLTDVEYRLTEGQEQAPEVTGPSGRNARGGCGLSRTCQTALSENGRRRSPGHPSLSPACHLPRRCHRRGGAPCRNLAERAPGAEIEKGTGKGEERGRREGRVQRD
ncbi:hypothetical protein SKAU_G00023740 [Synaphobranchus kaupii]|uniref:Uncharacterized protein n=1 Tax=Synaphobranchus kaupii TaxID=118154 RepID=A0A9Q1JCG5_SYNKA|nr:hypothetical protein SKAU_G00023740 [Synaphobranchus kaupii]